MKMMKKMIATFSAAAVAAFSMATMIVSADLPAREDPPYTAFLALQAGGDYKWVSETDSLASSKNNTTGTEASITGDGSYTVDVVMVNGSETIEAMILSTDINAYAFAPEGAVTPSGSLPEGCTANIEIDSVEVHHAAGDVVSLPYQGVSDGALRTADDGTSIRVNLLNVWTTPKVNGFGSGEDFAPEGGLAAGDRVVVNFTVSGINAGGGTAETTAPAENSQGDTTTSPAGGGADDTTTAAATNADGTPATTAASGASTNANNNNRNSNSNNSSSNSGSSNNTSTVSETSDFGVAAVVLGAVAAASLGVGAYTITRRKK